MSKPIRSEADSQSKKLLPHATVRAARAKRRKQAERWGSLLDKYEQITQQRFYENQDQQRALHEAFHEAWPADEADRMITESRGVFVPAALGRICGGSLNQATLLAQIFFWYEKRHKASGRWAKKRWWTYQTYEQLSDQTGMSVDQVRGARKGLEELGFILAESRRPNYLKQMHWSIQPVRIRNALRKSNDERDARIYRKQCKAV